MIIKLSESSKDFFNQVYLVVQEIPFGRVTSYGAIANYLGAKKSSRMVGWAMNASHRKENIPAHRVVNRGGGTESPYDRSRIPSGEARTQLGHLLSSGVRVVWRGLEGP